MPEKEDIKKALDRLMGDEFTAEQLQAFQLFYKAASWNIEEGSVTSKSFIVARKFCQPEKLLDVGGYWWTGSTGTAKFLLKDFICLSQISFDYPINVVATPLGERPAFLTLKHNLVMSGTSAIDVEIEVFTWDANGAPLPKISFDWRCRVPYAETIF